MYHQLEQYEQALADSTRAFEIRPDEWAYLLRAAAYNYLDKGELAQADHDRAFELVPRAKVTFQDDDQ